MRKIVILVVFLFFSWSADAQSVDSLNPKPVYKKAIIPAAMMATGLLLTNSTFEKNLQSDIRNGVGNTFYFAIDDYAQYVPIATMYIADMVGVKAKNHWFDQSKYLLISNIISSGITHSLKNIINKTRPNGGDYSFPSGHTTFAFTNASVVYQEFKGSSPLIAYSGYAFAATTGTFRVLNNKHWVSDVLVGAGIGILVTELVYYFEPLKGFNPFKNSERISFVPNIGEDNYGFYFSYSF